MSPEALKYFWRYLYSIQQDTFHDLECLSVDVFTLLYEIRPFLVSRALVDETMHNMLRIFVCVLIQELDEIAKWVDTL